MMILDVMNKEQLKQYYRRFCRWQQEEPHYVNRHEGSVQHCCNCGTEFAGNFCPICGQRAGVGRVGWNSVKENVALLWGMDSRSLTYTLVQLLGRPGYLVRDYISGRRLVSFPPVKMLVIVCLFVVIFEMVFHLHRDVLSLTFNNQAVNQVIEWINSQKNWATLLVNSVYILPTWLVFRFAPGYPRHTLPMTASSTTSMTTALQCLWLKPRNITTTSNHFPPYPHTPRFLSGVSAFFVVCFPSVLFVLFLLKNRFPFLCF